MPPKGIRRPAGVVGRGGVGPKRAAVRAYPRRRPAAGREAGPGVGADREEKFDLEEFNRGVACKGRLVPVEVWKKGMRIILSEASYWEEPIKASGDCSIRPGRRRQEGPGDGVARNSIRGPYQMEGVPSREAFGRGSLHRRLWKGCSRWVGALRPSSIVVGSSGGRMDASGRGNGEDRGRRAQRTTEKERPPRGEETGRGSSPRGKDKEEREIIQHRIAKKEEKEKGEEGQRRRQKEGEGQEGNSRSEESHRGVWEKPDWTHGMGLDARCFEEPRKWQRRKERKTALQAAGAHHRGAVAPRPEKDRTFSARRSR